MYKIFLLLFLFIYSSFSIGQMQDVKWKSLPSPSAGTEAIEGKSSSLEITEDGRVFFIFFDLNSNFLRVKKLNILTNQWVEIHNADLTGNSVFQLETYTIQNEVFITLSIQNTGGNISTWRLNPDETFDLLINMQSSIMDIGALMDFVINKIDDELYMITTDMNSGLYVERYNLLDGNFVDIANVGYMSFGKPKIAIDHINDLLVVMSSNGLPEYRVHTSPFGTMTFTGINLDGEITSPLFPGNADGPKFELNEKLNSQPNIILDEVDIDPASFRLSLPGSSVTEVDVEPAPGMGDYAVAGKGANDYVLAQLPSINKLCVLEIEPNGTISFVAANNNPAINDTLTTTGEAYALAKSPLYNRVSSFYHLPGNNGTAGGFFMITNNEPTITNINVANGCVGQQSAVVRNIVFNDLDGDKVIIMNNITSSNPGVIDPALTNISQSNIGHWFIETMAVGAGSASLTFEYTDGLDTLTQNVMVTVADPIVPQFEATNLEFCINQPTIDFNDYVNEQGGVFDVQGILSHNGSFNFDTLGITAFPHNTNIDYYYEDVNGCLSNASSTLTIYDYPEIMLDVTNTTCGNSDGEITASVISPNGNYNSYWNTGDQGVLTTSNLLPGTYYFNVLDEKGCISVAQEDVIATDFVITGGVTHPKCFGSQDGGVSIEVFGGSGDYNIIWSSGHSSEIVTGLQAGSYEVHVRDSENCRTTKRFDLVNPPRFNVDYELTKPDCGQPNGSIALVNSSGGSTPYTFEWNTGETTQNLSAIDIGFYQVTVKDVNECKAIRSFNVNSNGAPMASIEDIRKSMCGMSNGKIDVSLTAFTGEQIMGIEWSNGENTEDITGLMPGDYECVISQSNGCDAIYRWNVGIARPLKPEICIVTVDSTTNTNLIVWEKPSNNPFGIDHYKIYRETTNAHEFIVIDTVHHSNISVFNDVVASPADRSWRYRISAVNSCGIESALSRPHKTIHLVIDDMGGGVNFVAWDNYEGFEYLTYDFWRHTDDTGWEIIEGNIPFNQLPNTTDEPPSLNGLDYTIEVLPPNGICTATEGKAQDYNSSRSNKPNTGFNPGEGTGDPNNSLSKEENESYSVAVYPNPSDGLLEVAVYQKNPSNKLSLRVVDLNGKVIKENNLQEGVNYLNLSNLDSGIYVLNVSDQDYSETFRIVIR